LEPAFLFQFAKQLRSQVDRRGDRLDNHPPTGTAQRHASEHEGDARQRKRC
jgi:hypothetical protein